MEQPINYITHLNVVLDKIASDSRMNPTHVSLYMALFHLWNLQYFKKEFFINREEIMSSSKIGSKTTYHRCLTDLNAWKYIKYIPSNNPFKGSRIRLRYYGKLKGTTPIKDRPESGTTGVPLMAHHLANNWTSPGQALVPYNKQIQTDKNIKKKKLNKEKVAPTQSRKHESASKNEPGNLKASHPKNYAEPL
ncbi:hypothetical protein OZ410_13335 [Robiginitalea sp. M366]|uniref:hypothetical protein n=1 Tax=Robiginitalea aestuariiviva TaxID=3036903 RepID=UPI00240D36E6|nr:hypothetical protein [Robiginitalea aestuariiviva]MDG1573306.1 hypothetical protein [Robiginitalea aestuariiviva]